PIHLGNITFPETISQNEILTEELAQDKLEKLELDKTVIVSKAIKDSEIKILLQELIYEYDINTDLEGINEHVPELLDNARIHTVEPFYYMRCHYSKDKNYFDVAIGEVGLGIKNTLVKNSTYSYLRSEHHMRAISKAFEPMVSGKSESRGTGLSEVHDYFFDNKQHLLFLSSGDGYYLIKHENGDTQIQSGNLRYNLTGVQILLRFGCNR
ncbi:hypothetical protein KKB99_08590, partial [bacterium]|nr:hypothetical protein [bacterium]MBU1026048.1 hypothetical protein [bacterium]